MAEHEETRVELHRNGGSRPIPDPTELTRIAITSAISALREILEALISGDKAVIETRLTGMDEAIRLVRKANDESPTKCETRVAGSAEILLGKLEVVGQRFATVQEQFNGIDKQFEGRDQRTRDSRIADQTALAAALQAAKDAVAEANKAFTISIDKSERATGDQIKQQSAAAEINNRAVNEKIDALDKRVTRAEGQGQGQGQMWGYIVGGVGLVGAVIAIFIALVSRVP